MHGEPEVLSLTSTWFIRPGQEGAAVPALAAEVRESEPETLAYLVHAPHRGDDRLQALPPGAPDRVVLFEIYRSADAFLRHVQGPAFTRFLERHGDLFVAANGKPFTFVEFLARRAGFIRPEAFAPAAVNEPENQHPSVMFDRIARLAHDGAAQERVHGDRAPRHDRGPARRGPADSAADRRE
ncbi:putative quinol monooxygenase [Sorangium sp. So ce118]